MYILLWSSPFISPHHRPEKKCLCFQKKETPGVERKGKRNSDWEDKGGECVQENGHTERL